MKNFVRLSGIAVVVAVVCLNIFHALNGHGIKTATSLHQSIIAQGTDGGDGDDGGDDDTGGNDTGGNNTGGNGNNTGDNDTGDNDTGGNSGTVSGSDCLRNESGGAAKKPEKNSTRCPNPCQNYYARGCDPGTGGCSPSFCK